MSRIQQLEKLLAQDPTDADLPYMIGLEHTKTGDFDAAIQWLDQAINTNPHHHYAYFQKAKAQGQLGDDDAAIQTLNTAIQIAQQDGAAKALNELSELKRSFEDPY